MHHPFADQVALFLVGALSAADQFAFEAHVADCAACAAELRQFADVVDALALATPEVAPAPTVRHALLARISPL